MTSTTDRDIAGDFLVKAGRFFTPGEVSPDLRTVTRHGGRDGVVDLTNGPDEAIP